MNKTLITALLLCNFITYSKAQTKADLEKGNEGAQMFNDKISPRDSVSISEAVNGWWKKSQIKQKDRVARWQKASFGMFIHWGVYSMYGNIWKGSKGSGYAEHLMRVKRISRKEYLDSAKLFNPIHFNAREWVLRAKKAGMQYLVVTAKHHDGFAMYPTTISSAYSLKSTKFQKDPMKELSDACHKYGLLFGFYYSHAFDWEDPNAPGNDWDYQNPGGDLLLGGANWFDTHTEWLKRIKKYVDNKAIPQIQELLKKYHPDILWFDTPHKLPLSENLRILKSIRDISSDVIVNGRLARTNSFNFGDYINTADRPQEFYPVEGETPWEAIPTTNESYGYSISDSVHKSASFFIQLLAKARSRGGNILLNIGPKGDGNFDNVDVRILDSLALWMKTNKQSVIGASIASLPHQPWGVTTKDGNNYTYLHIFQKGNNDSLLVGGLHTPIKSAIYLDNGKKIQKTVTKDGLTLLLEPDRWDNIDAVVRLELDSSLSKNAKSSTFYLSDNGIINRLLAFDASFNGARKFSFGDGKKDKYYITNWMDTSQWIYWPVVVPKTTAYRVSLRYIVDKFSGGTFLLKIGDKDFRMSTDVVGSNPSIPKNISVGKVVLKEGESRISIVPIKINGKKLMDFLELDLVPE